MKEIIIGFWQQNHFIPKIFKKYQKSFIVFFLSFLNSLNCNERVYGSMQKKPARMYLRVQLNLFKTDTKESHKKCPL